MTTITVTEIFKATPENTFKALTDFANAAEHHTAVISVEMLTDGPLKIGTKFRETRKMFGKEEIEEMTVIALGAPNSIELEAFNHGARYHFSYMVTPIKGFNTVLKIECLRNQLVRFQ